MRVFQHCGNCGEEYSADSGDYFMVVDGDKVQKCGNCKEPLELAVRCAAIVTFAPSTINNMVRVEQGELTIPAHRIVPTELLEIVASYLNGTFTGNGEGDAKAIAERLAEYL